MAIIRHPRIGEYAIGFITSSVVLQVINYIPSDVLSDFFGLRTGGVCSMTIVYMCIPCICCSSDVVCAHLKARNLDPMTIMWIWIKTGLLETGTTLGIAALRGITEMTDYK